MKRRNPFIIAGMALLCLASSGGARPQSQGQNYIFTRTYLNEDGRATSTFTDL